MSLRDFAAVDIVMRVPGETAKAALIASDCGEVTDPHEREALLQKKLAFYLEFVRSGQFKRSHPELAEHTIIVEVVCILPPTDAMRQINGIRDPDGTCSMSVSVTSDQEFRSRYGLKQRPT